MKKFDEINIIPFIDIMLVLLAIVLITASFISQGKIQVNVPKASSTVAFKSDELAKLLTVTADKQLYFNDKPISQEALEKEIAELEDLLGSERKIRSVICKELEQVAKKYGQDRKTGLVYDHEIAEPEEEETPDYPVTVFLSREGYFKKITPQSLRMSGEQKFKEGDGLLLSRETTNNQELLVFTDRAQVYKTRLSDFPDGKASALGDYLPGKLGFDEGEGFFAAVFPGDYTGNLLFVFENGKAAKVELSGYATKTNRRKLTGAYSDKSPLRAVFHLTEEEQIALYATDGRCLIFSTAQLAVKTTRATQGVAVMSLKKKAVLERAARLAESGIQNPARYRTRTIPAAGALLREDDLEEKQMTLEL